MQGNRRLHMQGYRGTARNSHPPSNAYTAMAVMALAKIYPRMLRFCKQQMPVSLKPSLKNVTSNFKDHLPITSNQCYPLTPPKHKGLQK